MLSFRKKYRITPDEEDVICERICTMCANLFKNNHKEKISEKIDSSLSREIITSDMLAFTYQQEVSVGLIESILGELRGGKPIVSNKRKK